MVRWGGAVWDIRMLEGLLSLNFGFAFTLLTAFHFGYRVVGGLAFVEGVEST
jgi:hypothetical protein